MGASFGERSDNIRQSCRAMQLKMIKGSNFLPVGRKEYDSSKLDLSNGSSIIIRSPTDGDTDFQGLKLLFELTKEISVSEKMNAGFEKLYEYQTNTSLQEAISEEFSNGIERGTLGSYSLPSDILSKHFVKNLNIIFEVV